MNIVQYLISDLKYNEINYETPKKKILIIILIWISEKIVHGLNRIINATWSIPFLLIIRIIRPWYTVRIGKIISHRIGHFIPDAFYQIILSNNREIKSIELWAVGNISNKAWYKIVKRNLNISKMYEHLYYWNNIIPGGEKNKVYSLKNSRDTRGLFAKHPTKIIFTEKENIIGIKWLEEFGWKRGEPFICLLNRDSQYLKNFTMTKVDKFRGDSDIYGYHEYRNSSIHNYEKSIRWLLKEGFWVIRMGKIAEERVNINDHKFIDYPFIKNKSDLIDIWLFSNCKGCISTGTGIDYLSWAQGIPSLILNYIPIMTAMTSFNSITVPKNLYWEENSHELNLSEYFEHTYYKSSDYINNKIIIRELNEFEILQATEEFIESLNNHKKINAEDFRNQSNFKEILRRHKNFNEFHGYIHQEFKIGAAWLRSKNDLFFN